MKNNLKLVYVHGNNIADIRNWVLKLHEAENIKILEDSYYGMYFNYDDEVSNSIIKTKPFESLYVLVYNFIEPHTCVLITKLIKNLKQKNNDTN